MAHGPDAIFSSRSLDDMAVFGGAPLFDAPIGTSGPARPDAEAFLDYSRRFHDARHYTNDGPMVRQLEGRLAQAHGAQRCIAFGSEPWALVLTLAAVARAGRTGVILPALVERRRLEAVAWAGLEVAEALDDETAVVLNLSPVAAPMGSDARAPVLFETALTAGGKRGVRGAAEIGSLEAGGPIDGFDGGYVITDDEALADQLAVTRGFGFRGQDNLVAFGLNAKLNEAHACLALASLDDLDRQRTRNHHRLRRYRSALKAVRSLTLLEPEKEAAAGLATVRLGGDWPLSLAQTVTVLSAEGVRVRALDLVRPGPAGDEPLPALLRLPNDAALSDLAIEGLCGFLGFIEANGEQLRTRLG